MALLLFALENRLDRFREVILPNLGSLQSATGVPGWLVIVACGCSVGLSVHAATRLLQRRFPVSIFFLTVSPFFAKIPFDPLVSNQDAITWLWMTIVGSMVAVPLVLCIEKLELIDAKNQLAGPEEKAID